MWAMEQFIMVVLVVVTCRLCKMASEAENLIILSFTNKAIQNIKEQFKKRYQHTGLEHECYI